jgi:uncharacterized membrane protein HdeD (DUF308 family)
MKRWLKEMMSSRSEVSHKRFIALVSLLVLIVLAFFSAFGHTASESLYYIFGSLVGGSSILTVIEKFNKNQQDV